MNDKEIEDLKRLKSEKTKKLNQLKADKEMYCQLLKQIDKKIEDATKE